MPRQYDAKKGPPRFRENRGDPHMGGGPFYECLSEKCCEQVTPNGITWNEGHYGMVDDYEMSTRRLPHGQDYRPIGNRAGTPSVRGGNSTVNGIETDCRGEPNDGNRSGE